MYCAILLLVMVFMTAAQGGVNEPRVEVLRLYWPSKWEIKEEWYSITAYISCSNHTLDTPTHPFPGQWNKVIRVIMTGCYPPSPPDPPVLTHSLAARGALPLKIKYMQLRDIPPDAKLNANYFEGLHSLEDLTVSVAGQDPPKQLDGNFLQSLRSLSCLRVNNVKLPPLPKNDIDTLSLERGLSLAALGDCNKLYSLSLQEWRLPKYTNSTGGWLAECKKIRFLTADRVELDSLRTLLSGIGTRETWMDLNLSNNALSPPDLRDLLQTLPNIIRNLYVENNNLTHIYELETQTQIWWVDLSRNKLTDFMATVRTLSASTKPGYFLTLDYNPLHDFCDNPWLLNIDGEPPLNMQFLSLIGTNTSRVCFSNWKITVLNISNNNIKELKFSDLPLIGNQNGLVVDVRNNPLGEVHFSESDYSTLTDIRKSKIAKVRVHTDTLPLFDCVCKNGWLGRALREDVVVLPDGARCGGGGELHAVPPDSLECDLEPCEPCTCRRQWKSRTVVMHCDDLGLRDIPSLPDLRELHLSGNHIDTIRAENLPNSLTLLDVRFNNISLVNMEAAEALFNLVERRVWLSGNPIACNCDNWPLLGALQNHRVQVEDYENVTCADGSLLNNLSQEQLCSVPSTVAWVWLFPGGAVLVGLLAILGALYTRYDRQLKVWLYARGCCLSYVCEEELDADRKYDAFVSFSHGDYEFVESHLLPGLEKGPHGYKVCVHYRDWVPGEMIAKQITRSVVSSRRTIIVLSANFVQSMWGMLEFRAAHVSALAEGLVRVLVIALEDTPPAEELPEELRLYLRSTTYLCWDDPWFWKKLRYALPHRAGPDNRIVPQEEHVRETTPPPCGFEMVLYEQK